MPKIICNIHTNYAMQYICHDNNATTVPKLQCNIHTTKIYAIIMPDLNLTASDCCKSSIHKYPQRHKLKHPIIRTYIHFKQR